MPDVTPADFHHPPGWFTRRVFNPAVGALTRLGLPLAGSAVLEVRGRKSGEWRRTPVNPLEIDRVRYLVAPRGNTQWARNLRANPHGRLRVGRRVDSFVATEVPVDQRPPILREYLRRWKWEVSAFFGGVGPEASDEDLLRIAPEHPVFRIEPDVQPSASANP